MAVHFMVVLEVSVEAVQAADSAAATLVAAAVQEAEDRAEVFKQKER